MAARYRSGYLVSRRREALFHAEALATGNAFTWTTVHIPKLSGGWPRPKGGYQLSRWRSFLIISRRSLAYPSMTRRASSNRREGLGFGAFLSERGSSERGMPGSVQVRAACLA